MRIEYRIREWRYARNLSQRDLEKKSGVSRSQISKYEHGDHHPTIMTLAQIALALHVEISDLYKLYK
jgi:transcriptional regulator with XRE-family HTH domain